MSFLTEISTTFIEKVNHLRKGWESKKATTQKRKNA